MARENLCYVNIIELVMYFKIYSDRIIGNASLDGLPRGQILIQCRHLTEGLFTSLSDIYPSRYLFTQS